MKNPVKFQFPSINLILVTPRAEKSGNGVAPTLFEDVLADLRNSSVIKPLVSNLSKLCTVRLAHVINSFIASQTGWPRSSCVLPPSPRSSALQIRAQCSPRSTKSCSLAMESWKNMSVGLIAVEKKVTYPNHAQEGTD